MSIHVVAILHARPGKEDELRELLEGLIEPTRGESGCIGYHLHTNDDDPAEFVFIEEWDESASLDAHFTTSHIGDAVARMPDLCDAELVLRRLTRIA